MDVNMPHREPDATQELTIDFFVGERLMHRLRRTAAPMSAGQRMSAGRRHLPVVPDWYCGDCAQPWPCRAGRDRLRDEHRRAPGAVFQYLGACYTRALTDLPAEPTRYLHARFLGWIPRRRAPNSVPDRRYERGVPSDWIRREHEGDRQEEA